MQGQRFFCAVIREIVDEAQQRNQMEEEIDELQCTLSTSNDAVFWLDLDGHVLWSNASVTKLLGYTVEEVTGADRCADCLDFM